MCSYIIHRLQIVATAALIMLVLFTKQTQGGAVWRRIYLVKRLTEKKMSSFLQVARNINKY